MKYKTTRVYHICQSTTGAMGAPGTVRRLPGGFRTEKAAQRHKPADNGRTVCFIEWSWKE